MPALVLCALPRTYASSTALSTVVRHPTGSHFYQSASSPVPIYSNHPSKTTYHPSMPDGSRVIELKLLSSVHHQDPSATMALSTFVINADADDCNARTLSLLVLDSMALATNAHWHFPTYYSSSTLPLPLPTLLPLTSIHPVATPTYVMELLLLPPLVHRKQPSMAMSTFAASGTSFSFNDKRISAPNINPTLPMLVTTSSIIFPRLSNVCLSFAWMIPHWKYPETSRPSSVMSGTSMELEILRYPWVHQGPASMALSMIVSARDLPVVVMPFKHDTLPPQVRQTASRALSTIVRPRSLIISVKAVPRYLSQPSKMSAVSKAPAITDSPVFWHRVPQHLAINRPSPPKLLLLLPLPLPLLLASDPGLCLPAQPGSLVEIQ